MRGKTKHTFKTRDATGGGTAIHYFATSVAEWHTGTDLDALLRRMKREPYSFNVYRIDLPESAAYEIEYYKPQVEGDKLHWVGFWEVSA